LGGGDSKQGGGDRTREQPGDKQNGNPVGLMGSNGTEALWLAAVKILILGD